MTEEESTSGHARAREATPPPLAREAHIRELMIALRYQPGRTPSELAERWGLAVGTVVNDACRASATLSQPTDDIPGARERMLVTAGGILDAIDQAVRDGDWSAMRSLVPALEVVRKVLGLASPDAGTSVNVLVDQRGVMRPEVARVVEPEYAAMLAQCRAAALEAGADADRFDAALARQAQAMVVEGGT
jgi:hypothetical protein